MNRKIPLFWFSSLEFERYDLVKIVFHLLTFLSNQNDMKSILLHCVLNLVAIDTKINSGMKTDMNRYFVFLLCHESNLINYCGSVVNS